MRQVCLVEYGNFTTQLIGFLEVPDALDLDYQKAQWLLTKPGERITGPYQFSPDFVKFLKNIPGVTHIIIEVYPI